MPWFECEEDGHTYYFNDETNECVWERPKELAEGKPPDGIADAMHKAMKKLDADTEAALADAKKEQKDKEAALAAHVAAGGSHWVETFDPTENKFYYYDKASHETTWEKPAEYVMAADDEMMHAVVIIQCAWRKRSGRKIVKARKAAKDAGANQVWYQHTDEAGALYYYNSQTGECQWDRPKELDETWVAEEPPEGLTEMLHSAMGKLSKDEAQKLTKAKRVQKEKEAALAAHVAAGGSHWVEAYDPTSHGFYYYDNVTQETTWEKPAEYTMAADDEMMSAVIKIQCAWRKKYAKIRMKTRRSQESHDDELGSLLMGKKVTKKAEASADEDGEMPVAAAPLEVDYKSLLTKIYMKANPKKLEDPTFIQSTLVRYKGREAELLAKLEAKYGPVERDSAPEPAKAKEEEVPVTEEAPKVVAKALPPSSKEEEASAQSIQKVQRGRNARRQAKKERESLTRAVMSGAYDDFSGTEVTDKMQADWANQYDVKSQKERLMGDKQDLVDTLQSKNFGGVDKRGLARAVGGNVSVWVRQFDPDEKSHYWIHSKSNVKTYTQPEDWSEDSEQAVEVEMAQGALKVQSMFRGHKSRTEVAEKVEIHRRKMQNLWVEQFDPQTKQMYYFNTESGEIQTEQPAEFVPGGSDERLVAVLKLQCNWRARRARRDAKEAKKMRESAEQEYFSKDVLVSAFGVEKVGARRKYVSFNKLQRDKLQSQREALTLAVDRLEAIEALRADIDAAVDPNRSAEDTDGDGIVDTLPTIDRAAVDAMEAFAAAYAEVKGGSVQLASMAVSVVSFEDVEAQLDSISTKLPFLAEALELACRHFVEADGWRLKKAVVDMGMPKLELIHGLPVVKASGGDFAKRAMPMFERLRRCCDFASHQLQLAETELESVREAEYAGVVDTFFDWHMATQEAISAVAEAVTVSKSIQGSVHREKERQQEARERKLMFSDERQQKMVDRILRIRKLQRSQRARFVEACQDAWGRGKILKRQDVDDVKVEEMEAVEAAQAKEHLIHQQAEKERSLRDKQQTSAWQAVKDGCSVVTLDRLIAEETRRRKNQEGLLGGNRTMSGKDFDIDQHDHQSGEVLLRNAVWFGQPHLVSWLISVGANVDKIDNLINKATNLHEAARAGHADICELLIQAGARQEARDSSGDTALHVACRGGWTTVVKVLLAPVVSPQEEDEGGGMTGMWQSVVAQNNKGWKAIQLTRKAGILNLLLKCDDMLPERMMEQEALNEMQQQRIEVRRSKNLSVIKRSKGESAGPSSQSAEQERLALAENEAAANRKKKDKKKKRKKQAQDGGVEFSQDWSNSSSMF
jgi:hypothetical protein